MSTDFEKVLVLDDRLGAITDKIKYQVIKGGQNMVSQSYKAISQSTSSIVFNVTIPSLETIVDREILFTSTVTLHITLAGGTRDTAIPSPGPTGITANEFLVNYGVTDALAPFPLHSLINTASATINNNTVTTNMQDVLPIILRLLDPEELAEYSQFTPTTLDLLANYADGVDKMQYVIASTGTGNNTRPCSVLSRNGGRRALRNCRARAQQLERGRRSSCPTRTTSCPTT